MENVNVQQAKKHLKLRNELIKRFKQIKERNHGMYEKYKQQD